MEENSRLSHFCGLQVLVGAFEHNVRNPETKYLICPFQKIARFLSGIVELLCHPWELSSLSWENICFHHLAVGIYVITGEIL